MARNSSRVDIQLSRAKVASVLARHSNASAHRAAKVTRDRIREEIVKAGRVDTGRMRDSLHLTRAKVGVETQWNIAVKGPAARYFLFQDQGTRAHGPKRANYMVFKPKGSSTFVFAKWVRGVTAGKFVQKAANRLTVRDFLP